MAGEDTMDFGGLDEDAIEKESPDSLTAEDMDGDDVMAFTEEKEPEKPGQKEDRTIEDQEPAEEEEGEPAKKEKPGEKAVGKKDKGKETAEEDPVVTYLGKDAKLKVRGKEYSLADFSPEDVKSFLQIGLRGTQRFQEVADKERTLAQREEQVTRAAQQLNTLMQRYPKGIEQPGESQRMEKLPPELEPGEYDTDEVKHVKAAAAQVWKQNQSLVGRLDNIEHGMQSAEEQRESQELLGEIVTLKQEYPLASVEEVIAVHALRPNIPVTEIVRKSHEIYSSRQHFDQVLKANPILRKEIKDEMVKEYRMEQQKLRRIPGKPSGGSAQAAPVIKPKPKTWEQAGRMAKAYMAKKAAEDAEES